jgi:hypothetical protein
MITHTERIAESEIQRGIFEWAALQCGKYAVLRSLYHTPNGGRRDAISGAKLKKEGVKSGVPDLCLPYNNGKYGALYIEVKTANGRISENQKRWLETLNRQGNLAIVCRSAEEARSAILEYIRG